MVVCAAILATAPVSAQEAQPVKPVKGSETRAAVKERIVELEQQIQELSGQLHSIKETLEEPEGQVQAAIADMNKVKKISFTGYIQTRYEAWQNEDLLVAENKDQFLVRRARLKTTAKPTFNTQAVLQIDVTDSVTLKDAYMSYFPDSGSTLAPTVTVGQMNWPFGFEIMRSSSVRETPERAQFLQAFFKGERDKGLRVTGLVEQPLLWEIGIYNGSGPNVKDSNNHKDFVGRLRYNLTENLDVGLSGYFGRQRESITFTPAGETDPVIIANDIDKRRLGLDFQYYLDNFTLMGEYVTGEHWVKNDLILDSGFYRDSATNTVQAANGSGYYLQGITNIGARDQGVLRYETFRPDFPAAVTSKTGNISIWHLGWIRWLSDAMRFKLFYQLNYSDKVDFGNIWRADWIVKY